MAAWLWGGYEPVGPLPQLMASASIVFAGSLLLLAPKPAVADEPPAREEAVSRRLAEVSHELRTPLTHILGFAEIIEKELFGAIGQRNVEYAGLIRTSGTHLLHLVNDLLDLSKIDAGRYDLELELFDARTVIDEVLRLSADSAARKAIALSTDAHGTPLPVRADSTAFRRMLINTVSNAIKFTPEQGRVTVEARASGPRLIIDTLDTGPGISEAERDRLGAPYVRGSSGAHVEGTGARSVAGACAGAIARRRAQFSRCAGRRRLGADRSACDGGLARVADSQKCARRRDIAHFNEIARALAIGAQTHFNALARIEREHRLKRRLRKHERHVPDARDRLDAPAAGEKALCGGRRGRAGFEAACLASRYVEIGAGARAGSRMMSCALASKGALLRARIVNCCTP